MGVCVMGESAVGRCVLCVCVWGGGVSVSVCVCVCSNIWYLPVGLT